MTPNEALNAVEQPISTQPPATTGMTTKVVKGSIWTLVGSVLPLAISFIATPLIIRFLGSEGYGVLLLVGLIPTYFTFADFGMSVASTKFASEAYGEGDRIKEGSVVRTAAFIASISSLVVAIPIFIFSLPIVTAFNTPEHLQSQASIALKIAAISFVVGIVGSIANSPMLARLRMDLNTVTTALPKILLAGVTPIILYFGAGIVGAISWAFVVGVTSLVIVLVLSGRLLPELFRGGIDRRHFRPLIKFGGAWFVAMIAAMLLVNLEKLLLTKMVSVKALAYYSVAFTVANMTTLFAQAMIQSLIPAFSQLTSVDRKREFNALFARSIRLGLLWLLPVLVGMFVVARPFFTLWLGEEFGTNSTLPFYILLVGLFFNLQATVPYISIIAFGRTDVFARLYWIELVVYVVAAFLLINAFGIVGAAAAWTIRAVLDGVIIIHLSKKYAATEFRHLASLQRFSLSALALVPAAIATGFQQHWMITAPLFAFGAAVYALMAWRTFVDSDEKRWITERYRKLRS